MARWAYGRYGARPEHDRRGLCEHRSMSYGPRDKFCDRRAKVLAIVPEGGGYPSFSLRLCTQHFQLAQEYVHARQA